MLATLRKKTDSPSTISEIASIKYYDGIPYLNYNEFKKQYPISIKPFTKGGYGKIYDSGTKFIVKQFKEDPLLKDLIIELNIYASGFHPCIMMPIAWTVNNSIGYLVMEKGIDLSEAYRRGIIKAEELLSDILSAVAFLNSRGIAHCDIKPENMIFHNGKAKLIDMGIARKGELNSDGQYYIRDYAYVPGNRDPEYSLLQNNNIKCEIYALGSSCRQIIHQTGFKFGDLYDYTKNITSVDWFIQQAKLLQDKRPTIQELLKNAPAGVITRRYTGTVFSEPLTVIDEKCPRLLKEVMWWLVEIARNNEFKAESLFLALHLINRLQRYIIAFYDNGKDTLKMFCCAVLSIVLFVNSDKNKGLDFWEVKLDSYNNKNFSDNFSAMIIHILMLTRGIITTKTYWDYATSAEDLLPLLYDTISCNYNPQVINYNTEGTNKCITVDAFLTKENIKQLKERLKFPDEVQTSQVYPCELDVKGDVEAVEFVWNSDNWEGEKLYDALAVLLHNRDVMGEVNLDIALTIFEVLIKNFSNLVDFILNLICPYDWTSENNRQKIIKLRVHPFKYNEEEIIPRRKSSE